MGVSRLGHRTDDIVWDEGQENDFFRRMPSALSLALEATDLESLAHATAKGAEVLWECSAEVVLPSEGELRRKIHSTALNGSRWRQGFRHDRHAAALRMSLVIRRNDSDKGSRAPVSCRQSYRMPSGEMRFEKSWEAIVSKPHGR